MDQKQSKLRVFLDPLLKANPLFVMVLGTCPALAVTTSLESAIGMGLLFTFVVFFSNLIISALRKIIPDEVRTPCYIVVIATFVTVVKILSSTFLPELYNSLGVFVSLLVVNCIVLGRAEAFASQNTVVDSMLDGVGNGIGYTWAIAAIALVREVLGAGTLTFGKVFTFIPKVTLPILGGFKNSDFSMAMPVFKSSAGGFLVLGIALAIIAAVNNHKEQKAKEAARAAKAAAAAAAKGGNN
ncbi:MAG: electron transport complex subunit RsxE [Bacilli bacterium]|nr:electron transport complex subunit RsxE [Bacilli bacterium]